MAWNQMLPLNILYLLSLSHANFEVTLTYLSGLIDTLGLDYTRGVPSAPYRTFHKLTFLLRRDHAGAWTCALDYPSVFARR